MNDKNFYPLPKSEEMPYTPGDCIIMINKSRYLVNFVSNTDPALTAANAIGLCNSTIKRIIISKDIPNKQDILRHEITHAVIYEYIGVDPVFDQEKVCEFVQRYSQIIDQLVNQIPIGGS